MNELRLQAAPLSTTPRPLQNCTSSCGGARQLDERLDYLSAAPDRDHRAKTPGRRTRWRPARAFAAMSTVTYQHEILGPSRQPVALAPIGSIVVSTRACAAVADAAGAFGGPMFQARLPSRHRATGKACRRLENLPALCARRPGLVGAIFETRGEGGASAHSASRRTPPYSRREREISKRYHAASSRDPTPRAKEVADWSPSTGARRNQAPIVINHRHGRDAKLRRRARFDVSTYRIMAPQLDQAPAPSSVAGQSSPPRKQGVRLIDGSFCRDRRGNAIALVADRGRIGMPIRLVGLPPAARHLPRSGMLHDEMTAQGMLASTRWPSSTRRICPRRQCGAAVLAPSPT